MWGRDRNLEKTNADNISLCSLKARSLSFLITEDEGGEEEEGDWKEGLGVIKRQIHRGLSNYDFT